jgi:hypothetical protein
MGRKIFVSYKYADNDVQKITNDYWVQDTVRDYVDKLEGLIGRNDIYKGEHAGEDQSKFKEDTIWEHLKNKIFDSSVTIVLISKNMKEIWYKDEEQWIYQEISYSLKELTRTSADGKKENKSLSNAIICVVLPDQYGRYDYYYRNTYYTQSYNDNITFQIIAKNRSNKKRNFDEDYIVTVKWNEFINRYQSYIDLAVDKQRRINEFNITKETN